MDISFLKRCKQEKVFPNFIKVKCVVANTRTNIVVKSAMSLWLMMELKHIYSKLSQIELKAYEVHLLLAKTLKKEEFDELLSVTIDTVNETCSSKREKLNKKFLRLENEKFIGEKQDCVSVQTEVKPVNFVTNLSKQNFTTEETALLQKGLKFSPKPNSPNIIDLVASIETGIKYCKDIVKQEISDTVKSVIKKPTIKTNSVPKNTKWEKALTSFEEKDCLYMKSDKGRDIVIMDKDHYKEKVLETINTCNFQLLQKNPLPSMIRNTNNALKEVETVYDSRTKWKLMTSNPSVPKLYCLPKTHKDTTNLKMRPIVSNCNAPSENITKWLSKFSILIRNQKVYTSKTVSNSLKKSKKKN